MKLRGKRKALSKQDLAAAVEFHEIVAVSELAFEIERRMGRGYPDLPDIIMFSVIRKFSSKSADLLLRHRCLTEAIGAGDARVSKWINGEGCVSESLIRAACVADVGKNGFNPARLAELASKFDLSSGQGGEA